MLLPERLICFAGQYDKAKIALKKVIDSGQSMTLFLVRNMLTTSAFEGDANEEKVFEVNFESIMRVRPIGELV